MHGHMNVKLGGVCAVFVWKVHGHKMVDPVNGSEVNI
jgi:hypothetical protein